VLSTSIIKGLAFSPDGRTLAVLGGVCPEQVALWHVPGGQELSVHSHAALHIFFSSTGRLLSLGDAGDIRDVVSGNRVSSIKDFDSTKLRAKEGAAIVERAAAKEVYDLHSATLVDEICTDWNFHNICMSRNGQFVAWQNHNEGKITLWDRAGQLIYPWECERFRTLSSISPDGHCVAVVEDNYWRFRSGNRKPPSLWEKLTRKFQDPAPREPRCTVFLLDSYTGAEKAAVKYARSPLFSPDGKMLAVIRDDRPLEIWDLPIRKPWIKLVGYAAGSFLGALAILRGALLIGKRLRSMTAGDERVKDFAGQRATEL
jgi:WD40 repeat protein